MLMSNVRLAVPADYSSIAKWDEFWGDRRQELQRAELTSTRGARQIL